MAEYEVYYTDSIRVTAEGVSDAERVALAQIHEQRILTHRVGAFDPMANVRVTCIQKIMDRP